MKTVTSRVDIKKIETADNFYHWAKLVNMAITHEKPELQDVFSRSDMDKLQNIFNNELDKDERRMVTFSIMKSQGEDVGLDFVYAYSTYVARRKFETMVNTEYEERLKEITEREDAMNIKEGDYETQIRNLSSKVERLEKELESKSASYSRACEDNRQMSFKLDSLDRENDDLRKVVNALETIKKFFNN